MLINVMVTPGDVQDRDAIAPLLEIARNRFPTLKKAIADGGYQGQRTADAVQQQAGIPLEIVKRSNIARGFYILPKRWIVERTYGWLGRCRRRAQLEQEELGSGGRRGTGPDVPVEFLR